MAYYFVAQSFYQIVSNVYYVQGSVDSGKKFGDTEGYIDSTFEPWSTKRSGILSKYTTSEKLSISTVCSQVCCV